MPIVSVRADLLTDGRVSQANSLFDMFSINSPIALFSSSAFTCRASRWTPPAQCAAWDQAPSLRKTSIIFFHHPSTRWSVRDQISLWCKAADFHGITPKIYLTPHVPHFPPDTLKPRVQFLEMRKYHPHA